MQYLPSKQFLKLKVEFWSFLFSICVENEQLCDNTVSNASGLSNVMSISNKLINEK